jgi:hypothetical protein
MIGDIIGLHLEYAEWRKATAQQVGLWFSDSARYPYTLSDDLYTE